MKTLAYIIATLVLSTVPALADDAIAKAAGRGGYSADVVQQIENLLDETEKAGLSVEPLKKKAIEGFAKRVPAPKLIEALRTQRARLAELRKTAPQTAKSTGLERAALTAMAGGLSASTIARLHTQETDQDRLQAAMYATGVLKSAGADEPEAATFLATQLQARLTPRQIDEVSQAAARALRAGLVTGGDLASVKPQELQGSAYGGWLQTMRGFGRTKTRAVEENGERRREDLRERSGETERLEPGDSSLSKKREERPRDEEQNRPPKDSDEDEDDRDDGNDSSDTDSPDYEDHRR